MNLQFYPSKPLTKDAVLDLITRFGIGIVLLVPKQQNAAIGSRVFANGISRWTLHCAVGQSTVPN